MDRVEGCLPEPSERELELERKLAVANFEIARLKTRSNEVIAHSVVDKLEECGQAVPPSATSSNHVSHMHDLPRVELATFDGSPVEYWKFKRQFEYYIESRIADPGQRLMYLRHYCRGRARSAIDACVMLPPVEGYARARVILKDLFGLPHVVARSLIDELLREAKRVQNTADSLSDLALKMENARIALKQMDYISDLNSIATLEGLVRCLPANLQAKWAETADMLEVEGCSVTFDQLTEFVSQRARIARGRFGQIAEVSFKGPAQLSPPCVRASSGYSKGKVFATTSELAKPALLCSLCQSSHPVWRCTNFTDADVKSRWEIVKRLALCFVCLRRSHNASDCKSKPWCTVNGCDRPHHTLLHYEKDVCSVYKEVDCNAALLDIKVCLGTLTVNVETPKGLIPVVALLDGGSDTTLIREDFICEHAMLGSPAKVSIRSLGRKQLLSCSRLQFNLHSLDGKEIVSVPEAYSVKSLPELPLQSLSSIAHDYPHLRGVDLPEARDYKVTILIGCNVPEAHWALEQRLGGRKTPFATKTLLGWVIQGPTKVDAKTVLSIRCSNANEMSLKQNIEQLYNTEFDDLSSESKTLSRNDEAALHAVSCSRVDNGRFHVPLPWKSHQCKFAANFVLAEKRLSYLGRRFERDPVLFERYKKVMQHHLDAGHIEKLPCTANRNERVWYLPHHPVLNSRKPDKLRVVFDCAAKYNCASLNDRLLQGPNLTNNLVEVLLRFRLYTYAIAADIEEMFLQVVVPKSDRDALRILWWDNNDPSQPITTYRMTVHPFGATSSPFCATYALRQTAETFGHLFDDTIGEYVTTNFYVDDLLLSLPTKEDTELVYEQLTQLLHLGGFRLTKWITNNRDLLNTIPLSERASSMRTIDDRKVTIERMLGISWDANSDEFAFDLTLPQCTPTRRGLLSIISGAYDPLGLVSPWIFPGKQLLQSMCKRQLGWDEPMNDELRKDLSKWMEGMHEISELRFPRCFGFISSQALIELHIFSDASEIGHGAVAYGCPVGVLEKLPVQLLFSKSRVNPLKAVSVPRLELNAAVLGVRIFLLLKRAYGNVISNATFWSDSTIVLSYIGNRNTRFSTFVANRLTYIHDHTETDQWRHIVSEMNPADLVSRGAVDLCRLKLWLNGPNFLKDPTDTWSKSIVAECGEGELIEKTSCNVVSTGIPDKLHHLLRQTSSWVKLIRMTAWLNRFKQYIVTMFGGAKDRRLNVGPLRLNEIKQGESDVLRFAQKEAFGQNFECVNAVKGRLRKLRPIIVDGLLKIGGRLEYSGLGESAVHPVIIPKKHPVTLLLIRNVHVLEGHAGPSHTLSKLRERYWVIDGLTTVKGVIRDCFICKRLNARPATQLMSNLPAAQVVSDSYPFSKVALDYFGPFSVKRCRSLEKRYGCLFTCLQCRAVHLEIAHSMSTDSFLMAMSRFIGRRGLPTDIYSDNGSNFVGADRILRHWLLGLDQERVSGKLLEREIRWHFNPPYSSHRGGIWERLIRSIRRALNATFTVQTPTDETLLTVFIEVERTLNNRPLVPLSSVDIDCATLCPNDLLLRRGNTEVSPEVSFSESFRMNWKQAHYLAAVFWKKWRTTYLPLLQERQRWLTPRRNFQIGDVVLVLWADLPKHKWPLGIVEETFQSEDGFIRKVTIRTKNGTIVRDVRNICLLEGAPDGIANGTVPEVGDPSGRWVSGSFASRNTTDRPTGRRGSDGRTAVSPIRT